MISFLSDSRLYFGWLVVLVVALIAFGAIAGMSALATGLNNAFSQISLTLTTNVS